MIITTIRSKKKTLDGRYTAWVGLIIRANKSLAKKPKGNRPRETPDKTINKVSRCRTGTGSVQLRKRSESAK
jgi:hypothetical protein